MLTSARKINQYKSASILKGKINKQTVVKRKQHQWQNSGTDGLNLVILFKSRLIKK